MSAPAWTPGPWRPNLHHTMKQGGRTYGFIHPPNDIAPVAVVPLGVEGMPEDAGRANAHLIAAAHDLYEALDCALDEYEQRNGRILDVASPHWSVAARAALAKARGEPHPAASPPPARQDGGEG